jgi:SNF2 family DNA or RNA helicase
LIDDDKIYKRDKIMGCSIFLLEISTSWVHQEKFCGVAMLNFRKLRQELSPNILKEGKTIYDKKMVSDGKILTYSPQNVKLSCTVQGSFDKTYQIELEIDLSSSSIIQSDCDCPYKFDCQHLAAVLFHLEEHFDALLVAYSRENDVESQEDLDEEEKDTIRESIKEAETKAVVKRDKKHLKELLQEYKFAANVLGKSPFFLSDNPLPVDKAELCVIFHLPQNGGAIETVDLQFALRLPYRSKPLHVPDIRQFLNALHYQESLYIGTKRYFFTLDSFEASTRTLLRMIIDSARSSPEREDKNLKLTTIEGELFGLVLAQVYDYTALSLTKMKGCSREDENDLPTLPGFYHRTFEEPLRYSIIPAQIHCEIELLSVPAPKILLRPEIMLNEEIVLPSHEAHYFECSKPGIIEGGVYYRFQHNLKRKHLIQLNELRDVTIPEPLFGTFVENSIPDLLQYVKLVNQDVLERFVTIPFSGELKAECNIGYLNGELEASLSFIYDNVKIPASCSQLTLEHITPFVTKEGVLARNLTQEQNIIEDLFQDFIYDPAQNLYTVKTDKKIIEFMTEVVPRNQGRVKFNCPQNLLDQFIFDDTTFKIHFSETKRIDQYKVELQVNGDLNGVTVDALWDCLTTKKSYIELPSKKMIRKKGSETSHKSNKILVLDLERIAPVIQIFDEIGLQVIENHSQERPLWSLASISEDQFEGLPIEFSMTKNLIEIQQQMLGNREFNPSPLPEAINATLRTYQIDGVSWLERLRSMHLNGILADDMGLGKTLQAIIALTQNHHRQKGQLSIVVCPTSLVYNWKEEINKFNPQLKVLPVDGTPAQRKKLQSDLKKYDVVITSYSLLQKDIEFYRTVPFAYAILDEAQHIKNRGTRNAKSVKMIQASHRLILTGTPIENSLDELWSLFDYLMPGLLSSYDRFVEKYVRLPGQSQGSNLEGLRKKVAPFILRRMKRDVLQELPPVSEIVYHCHLTQVQKELYQSYAKSAREELSKLVKKEGFDKVQIHVLATLTRLKQICCHPAIFAKENPEVGDSAKYDMLMDLLQSLIGGGHKTVIFSQYTKMLNIMRDDLQKLGIRFQYLDGTSKNRLEIVNEFNNNAEIPVFLVSLKAGGSGLNLVGADTVIHYDMWWNPAVENQATDRVHRLGQKNSVSSYKLVTLDTIEVKIVELQERKKGLENKIVGCDDEAIAKLTWEEVLELLQT